MRKSLGILIALGLCLSFLPVHAEEPAAITSRIVEAAVHADKTITVTETLRLRLPEHEAYELFLDLPAMPRPRPGTSLSSAVRPCWIRSGIRSNSTAIKTFSCS